jgi:intracellular sulfur oxidation DsrE/DsrF family protein
MLTKSKHIAAIKALMQRSSFCSLQNTRKSRKITKEQLIPEVGVCAGIAEVVENKNKAGVI